MKQVIQYANGSELTVEEVPPPALRAGGVLVATRYSLVSTGTERTAIELAKKSLVGKALERPDLVKQVLRKVKTEGFSTTLQKVKGKLDAPIALGYSSAGTVIATAEDVDCFEVGDRVACAGAGYASHAEVVFVPKNLCVKIPDNVDFEQAAYVTVGAIAMHGVRVAEVTLGECVAVIGLGLLGQLTVQILKSAGCRALGVDIDPNKTATARDLGADAVAVRGTDDVPQIAADFSRGRGVDATIITAATGSNDPIELAAELTRDKGRVSVVGAVKMDVPRRPYYEKELDIRLSRSYGPGRYDPVYEEHGVDYPIGYVRWTERRNMEAFVDLLSAGKVRTRELATHTFQIDDARSAYEMIGAKNSEPILGILLTYPERPEKPSPTVVLKKPTTRRTGKIGVGVIGTGNFSRAVLLPNLAKLDQVDLRAVSSVDGVEAKRAAERFGVQYATSSAEDLIGDESIDAVVIATMHDTHVDLASAALESGKHVFLEKPLAMNDDQLEQIIAARQSSQADLVVDFNRRLAPLTLRLKQMFRARACPLVMSYRVNAGFIPKDSWLQDPVEGGGRIIGEVCHFVDLMQYLCDAPPREVYAASAHAQNEQRTNADNTVVTLKFADGSVGTLAYTADGDPAMPKERLEVFADQSAFVIDDFRSAALYRGCKSERIKLHSQDKGHSAMLKAFVDFASGDCEPPVPFAEAVAATRATLAILESLGLGVGVELEH